MDERLLYRDSFFIGGEWHKPAGSERLGVISPSTEDVVGEVPVAVDEDMDRAVEAAREAFERAPGPGRTLRPGPNCSNGSRICSANGVRTSPR